MLTSRPDKINFLVINMHRLFCILLIIHMTLRESDRKSLKVIDFVAMHKNQIFNLVILLNLFHYQN